MSSITAQYEPPRAGAVIAGATVAASVAAGLYLAEPRLTTLGNVLVIVAGAVLGALAVFVFHPSPLRVVAVGGSVVALTVVGLSWQFLRLDSPVPAGVVGINGGCDTFKVYAQNRLDALGARKMAEPLPNAKKVGGFDGNEIVSVDGWARTDAPYPTNSEPWNSNIWFHLADQSGRVAFAGVRAAPSSPDPTHGFDSCGGEPVALDDACRANILW